MLSFLKKIIAVALLMPLLAYGVGVVINWRDAPKLAQIAALEAQYAARENVSDENNAYIFMAGFLADQSEDPIAAGQAWVAHMNKGQYDYRVGKDLLDKSGCVEYDCFSTLTSAEMRLELDENMWIIERYLQLLGKSQWQERVPSSSVEPFVNYVGVKAAKALFWRYISLLAENGELALAQEYIELDLQLWRMVHSQSGILISKMVAIAYYKEGLNRALSISGLDTSKISSIFTPFSSEEFNFERVFWGELLYSRALLLSFGVIDFLSGFIWGDLNYSVDGKVELNIYQRIITYLIFPFFKLQDTENKKFSSHIYALNINFQNTKCITEEYQTYVAGLLGGKPIYNPVGELLLSGSGVSMAEYVCRSLDMEGVRQAFIAAYNIRQQKPENPLNILNSIPQKNPYTGRPFEWDGAEMSVRFQGLSARDEGLYVFPAGW